MSRARRRQRTGPVSAIIKHAMAVEMQKLDVQRTRNC
jgi:hypothetical protein